MFTRVSFNKIMPTRSISCNYIEDVKVYNITFLACIASVYYHTFYLVCFFIINPVSRL